MTSEKKQVWPIWLKWSLGLSFGFLGFIILIVLLAHQMEKRPEITTWDQWEKHREYIKSLSKNVMLSRDATAIYAKANNYWKDEFYKNCNVEICGEFKGFIRTAKEAAEDGILTPIELNNIATQETILNLVIKEKNVELKKKFNK